jgi:hypothetical protein
MGSPEFAFCTDRHRRVMTRRLSKLRQRRHKDGAGGEKRQCPVVI